MLHKLFTVTPWPTSPLACRVAVLFEWKEPFTHITACEYPEGTGEYTVLPEWYYTESEQVEYLHPMLPPSGEASGSSGKQGTMKEKLN